MQVTLEGNSYLRFYSAIPSPDSRRVYANCLKHFMTYLELGTPEDLILSNADLMEQRVMSYIKAQKDVGLSSSVIRVRLAAIKLFYDMNKVTLAWKIVNKTIGEQTRKLKDRPYSTEEIKKILDKADIRLKVIVLLLCSTGMRIGALPDLKVSSLHKVDNLYRITVYERTNYEYETFCTPECAVAIDEWLAFRKRYGEVVDQDAPLIRDAFDRVVALENFGSVMDIVKGKPLHVSGIGDCLRRALIDAGLLDTKYTEDKPIKRIRHQIKRAHGFRKFYDTESTKAGVHPLYIELLMGHNIALKGSYFKPSSTDLLYGNDKMNGYVSAIDALTIDENMRLKRKMESLETEKSGWEKAYNEAMKLTGQLKEKGLL